MFAFTRLELQTYLILTVCWVSIALVNMLEQPYARSLVKCDVPVNTTAGAPFSGSNYCGNRLHVIDVGADISGRGQSLENVGRILITFFVSGFADRGRRNAAILGQCLITASTALFFLAGFVPGLAVPIYVIAQGLQGMSGIGILDQIVTGDVALQLDDSVGVYQRKNTFAAIMMFLVGPLVCYIQYAEFTDFTMVWMSIVAMNTAALLLLICFFPETMSKSDKESKATTGMSLLDLCKQELRTFRSLVTDHRLIRFRLIEEFFNRLGNTMSISLPFMMAVFGVSQIGALASVTMPAIVLTPIFMPLIPQLFERYPRRVWSFVYWSSKVVMIGCCFVMPLWFGEVPAPIFCTMLMIPFAGFMTILQAVEIRLVGAENNAKYQAMMQLIGFFCESITSFFYAWVFDAEATTYIGKCRPYLIAAVPMALSIPGYLIGNGPLQLEECSKLATEKAAERAAEKAKADGASAEQTEDTKKSK